MVLLRNDTFALSDAFSPVSDMSAACEVTKGINEWQPL